MNDPYLGIILTHFQPVRLSVHLRVSQTSVTSGHHWVTDSDSVSQYVLDSGHQMGKLIRTETSHVHGRKTHTHIRCLSVRGLEGKNM